MNDHAADTETVRPPVFGLDPERIGQIVIKLGAAAAMAGHKNIRDTLRDYVHVAPGSELEFIRDLFTRRTPVIAEKWYGDEFEATCMAVYLLAEVYGGGRPSDP